ncbi:hypothetical protein DFH09DRAFT_1330328 [Mycena vulgaris]|nr:hypothetical protein DFH09DRAFT_1330328 [Mycena vulgaris]
MIFFLIFTHKSCDHVGERTEIPHSIESRPAFLDDHLVNYVNGNGLPPSLKVRPIKGDAGWTFFDKWTLRQAVKPFITDEVFQGKKIPYNAPIARSKSTDSTEGPLQAMLVDRITRENVDALGLFDWERVNEVLAQYMTAPEFSPDGGVNGKAQLLMYVLSFVILQEWFSVLKWVA